MEYKYDQEELEELLALSVRDLTVDEVEDRYRNDPERWKGNQGGQAEKTAALSRIKTSVMIDAWTIADFNILDPEAFVVGVVL